MKLSETERKLEHTENELLTEKDSQNIMKRELIEFQHEYKIIQG